MRTINTSKEIWIYLAVIFIGLAAVGYFIWSFISVFGYVIGSIAMIYLINPLIRRLEKFGLSTNQAFGIIVISFLIVIIGFAHLGVPTIKSEVQTISTNWEQVSDRINQEFLRPVIDEQGNLKYYSPIIDMEIPTTELDTLQQSLISSLNSLLTQLPTIIFKIIIIVPIFTFLLISQGKDIRKKIIDLIPNRYFEIVLAISNDINESIEKFISAKLIQSVIVAIVCCIGFAIIDLKFAILLGILAGILNIIPYLGPLLGSIGPVTVGYFLQDINTAGLALLVIIIAQFVDNALTQPILLPKLVHEHPLVVLIITLLGAELMGAVGLILAIPIYSILKIILVKSYRILDIIYSRKKEKTEFISIANTLNNY